MFLYICIHKQTNMEELTMEAARDKMVEAWKDYCWWMLCTKMFALLAGREATYEQAFRTVYLSDGTKPQIIDKVAVLVMQSYGSTQKLLDMEKEYRGMIMHPNHEAWLMSLGFEKI